jgi:ATP-dependent helicase HepA
MSNPRGESDSLGAFVKVTVPPHDVLGVGKLTRVVGRQGVVRYFDVPDDLDPLEVVVPITALRVVDLPTQTRVFHLDETTGRWRVGRVIDGAGQTLLVQFPNGQSDNLHRREVYTRWRRPIADPAVFLSRKVNETPLFARERSSFVQAVVAHRAASLGMGALLSSGIQLVPYQFNVIRRVLQDPVQRYLLADEVGLGKTIEAGVLIRQYILDEPATARVLVIAPRPLVDQWKQELAGRFNLAAWLDDFVQVTSADDLESVSEHIIGAGMLVVDEAHQIARLAPDGSNPLYDLLNAHAQRTSRLLLLSATPVLSDAAGFLRVLHLLDPVVFPLDDLAGFEERLLSRQLVAEVVAALVPENLLSLEDDLDRLQGAFRGDLTLGNLISTLRPIVQALPDEADEAFLLALGELRAHLSETYKLHRRILRNRRKSVPWATPRRSGVEVVGYDCVTTGAWYRALDTLRVRLANIDVPKSLHLAMLALAVHPEGALGMTALLHRHGVEDSSALELAQRVDHLGEEVQQEALRSRVTAEVVKRLLATSEHQVVVFCDRAASAELVADDLRRALSSGTVRRHEVASLRGCDEESKDDAWEAFLTDPIHCRVLVCDASAEEGLNLHGGKKIAVHYDLPPSPNRIEQRLGRLDRYGSGDAIKSVVLVCHDNKDEEAWLACLSEGLQVFAASIASLQYLIEESLQPAAEAWAGEGATALMRWCSQLAGPSGWVARERRRIDQQDALDALSEAHGDAFDELEAVDAEWQAWKEAFDGFALGMLQFRKRSERWDGALPPKEQVFRLAYSRDPGAATLVTLNAFMAEFLGTVDREAPGSSSWYPLTFAYAYRRGTALSKEGMARKVKPLRYGEALVDSLYAFCESDDRGRAYAMWRHTPAYTPQDASGVDLFFRFDFMIEADLRPAEGAAGDETRALRRRVEAHFPPRFYSVWVLPDGSCVRQAPSALEAPYRSTVGSADLGAGRDYNLNAQRWRVLDMQSAIPWLRDWSKQCGQAGDLARAFVLEIDDLKATTQRGLKRLREQRDARAAQLKARAARVTGAALQAELADLQLEEQLHRRLAAAVTMPLVRMDSAGAVFVAATSPFAR